MELFVENTNGQRIIYMLENIEEDLGILNLNKDHTLVILFEPANHVEVMKLDGNVKQRFIQKYFGLDAYQSETFARLLNRHVPNKNRDDS